MSAGSTIKMLRNREGISQFELSLESGVTQGMISLYETGKSDPRVAVFEKLLNAMGYELVVRKKRSEP